MDRDLLTGTTKKEVAALTAGKNVVLIAPSRNQNAFIDYFDDPKRELYKLTVKDAEFVNFLNNFITEMAEKFANFGHQTLQAFSHNRWTGTELADAFAVDLSAAQITTLILDEFDWLEADQDTRHFFTRLAQILTDTQLVIKGRALNLEIWGHATLTDTTVVVGDIDGIYSSTKPTIQIQAFGSGQVFVDGLPMDTWDGPLPRNLFYYFVDHPMVTRDEIFETFWPELNTKEATNVFHVTKRKISERLGYELTTHSQGFYRPSKEITLHYDVKVFEDAYNAARAKNDKSTIADWEAVIELYRTEFLHDLDMPWINERRDVLRDEYAEALTNVARLYESARNFEMAVHFFLRALVQQPLREDLYRALMTIYDEQREYRKAVELYRQFADILYRKLKIKPSAKTIQLYNIIEAKL